jgi:hypothetical protein
MTAQRIVFAVLALSLLGAAAPAGAQTKRAPRPGEVEADPIRCWWKTDHSAIRVGERFTLLLTCGVIETTTIKVVPVVNQLEPGAISLTPFEAVSGERRADVVVSPWRYLQYEYSMRLLNEGFFGQDVNVPPLTVTYNVQVPGAGNTEGRDQTYVLPALPMRVLSIVPRNAMDIRDASGQTFADVESRRGRATAELVAASIAFAFAGVLVALALVRLAGRFRVRDARAVRPLPVPALLRGSMRALRSARREATGQGWSAPAMARAIAALRVAGSVAVGRPAAQLHVANGQPERIGQIEVRRGLIRRRRVLVSASTTPAALLAAIENGHGGSSRATLQPIMDALQAFSVAVYGRAGEADTQSLNNAVDDAASAMQRMWLRSLIPFSVARANAGPTMGSRHARSAV